MNHFSREFDFHAGEETLRGTIDTPMENTLPRVLSLHGAGPSNRARMTYLAEHLARQGFGTLRFDFSGWGDSSGQLEKSSLSKRFEEASTVASRLDASSSTILIGTSMGGHVAARLSNIINPSHLILFCPAAYAAEAEEVTFGPHFSEILRRPRSYANSLAYDAISRHEGRVLILIGTEDEIIPQEVIDLYLNACKSAKSIRYEILSGVPHQIHGWAANNPDVRKHILSLLDDELSR